MPSLVDVKAVVVVPNWNGISSLKACLDSLVNQSVKALVIVVDNGSVDGSVEFIEKNYPEAELIKHKSNMGFAGGVNPGFKRAIELGAKYAATLNNDAVADKQWLEHLIDHMVKHTQSGIATCKLLTADGKKLDSTGEIYTNWGLPYSRGRDETDLDKYDDSTAIFAASGGASLYRVSMLEAVGLFDEDFFAYYEDVDLSFRAQLAGWKVDFVPSAQAYHQIGATSGKIKGFSTYQTMKNQPLLLYKNMPRKYLFRVGWRFTIAHVLFYLRAISRKQGWIATKGDLRGSWLLIKKGKQRRLIQSNRQVSDDYIWSMFTHDLPPNAKALRKLRSKWWKLTMKSRRSL